MNRPVKPAELPLGASISSGANVRSTDGVSGNSKEPTPTERRQMLINADRDFPQETAEELVDRMVAEGKISLATAEKERPAKEEPERKETLVLAGQEPIFLSRDDQGNLELRQYRWPDDDAVIMVNADYLDRFVDSLTDALGYGGSTP